MAGNQPSVVGQEGLELAAEQQDRHQVQALSAAAAADMLESELPDFGGDEGEDDAPAAEDNMCFARMHD